MRRPKGLSWRFAAGIAVLAIILVVVAVAVRHYTCSSEHPQCTKTTYVLLEGTLESDEVDVSSKIPGRIGSLTVEEGDPVIAGKVLATLESKEVDAKVEQASGMFQAAQVQQSQAGVAVDLQARTVQDQVEQAQAGYKAARAKLDMAMNGARPQEIVQAEKAFEQASATFDTAKSTYERFHGLYKEGVIPKQREEEIELQYRSAKAQKEAAAAKLSLVKEGARTEEIQQAQAGLKAAEAALRLAQDSALQVSIKKHDVLAAGYKASAARGQLDEARSYQSETKIVSPISGYVSQRMSDSGEMVSAGFPIFTIVKSRDFKVKVYADESKFGHLELDQTVKILIPALANVAVDGKIIRISQSADFATKKATNEQGSFDIRSLELVVKVIGEHPDLRNGMTARVRLPYAARANQ